MQIIVTANVTITTEMRKENAVMPVNPEKTQAAWSVWKAKWKEMK